MTRILLVEDDYAIADNLQALLQIKGYRVSFAPDGQAAVETARSEKPHLILLDIMLPKLGGFDVCRILKSEEKTKGIKIIVITGLGRVGDVEKAFASGADDYVIKPVDSARLIKKIEAVLARP